ncbi:MULTISPECIES: hypothetical protein [Prochlorococcus]|uniref:hypothetical protein n=1 Tax=Prochlorococcus TaxID=1218 RepID=UPI00053393B8|nr:MULTISPECIES: hypothetical protein [Prochlorococcus]KGG13128.1 hypothetical protein EV05_0805 [Prochlorococcus sp. MIT 0601]
MTVITLIAGLNILLGFLVLFLPLMLTELSRPKDSFWGALIIVFGLILLLEADSFDWNQAVALFFATVIFLRLLWEVSSNRWHQLTLEEQTSLRSFNRWNTRLSQLLSAFLKLGSLSVGLFKVFTPRKQGNPSGKKWVRPSSEEQKEPIKSEEALSSVVEKAHESSDPDQISSLNKENAPSNDS